MTASPGIIASAGKQQAYALAGYTYNGSSNYGTLNPLAGAIASKQHLLSLWVKVLGGLGTTRRLFMKDPGSAFPIAVNILAGNNFGVSLIDASGSIVLARNGFGSITNDGSYHNLLWSVDTAVANSHYLYLDDVLIDGPVTAVNNAANTAAVGNWVLGGRNDGSQLFNGCMADFFYAQAYLDLSVTANRRKFISASKQPVNLGADGSIPLGSVPLAYIAGRPSVNGGSGGNFTEHGAFSPC